MPSRIVREIVANLGGRTPSAPWDVEVPDDPLYDPLDIYGIVPADHRVGYDVREVIARLVDRSRFHEFKPLYGDSLVCGFARLEGYPSGSWRTTASSSPSLR